MITKEEMEFINQWKDCMIVGFCIADGEKLLDIISKLMVQNDKLLKAIMDVDSWDWNAILQDSENSHDISGCLNSVSKLTKIIDEVKNNS